MRYELYPYKGLTLFLTQNIKVTNLWFLFLIYYLTFSILLDVISLGFLTI